MAKESRTVMSFWVMLPIMLLATGGAFGTDAIRLIATAREGGSIWKYLESNRRMTNWMGLTFNDKKWKSGSAGFGNMNRRGLTKTPWSGGQKDLYLRKEFKCDFKAKDIEKVELQYAIDDTIEVYLNGKPLFNAGYFADDAYNSVDVTDEFKRLVREKGRSNILAVKAHDMGGKCFVDVGLVVNVRAANDNDKKNVSNGRDSDGDKEIDKPKNSSRIHKTGEVETDNRDEKKELRGVDRCEALPSAVESIYSGLVQVPGLEFFISKTELTQAQWEAVTGSNPSHFKDPGNPVETVSYDDAVDFIAKLNAFPGVAERGLVFRLPHEGEWRRAAGKGFSGEEEGLRTSWVKDNSSGTTHKVGTKYPNEFGLYDMQGNVWEWTDRASNGKGSRRGGSYCDDMEGCRLNRWVHTPSYRRYDCCGLRLAADRASDVLEENKNTAAEMQQQPKLTPEELKKIIEAENAYDKKMLERKFGKGGQK